MTHPYTPGASADTCYTVLPPGHEDSENPGGEWACGRSRLHLAHAIPFDRIHGFVPAASHGEACGVLVVEADRLYDCGMLANAAVHDVGEEARRENAEAPFFPPGVIDRALTPAGPLFPGPEVDGRPTWFCLVEDVPEGHEWRTGDGGFAWTTGRDGMSLVQWCQTRRRLPVPGDQVWVASTGINGQRMPVSFAEVVETVVYAMSPPAQRTGDSSTTMDVFVATAVWRLLTEGTTGA